MIRLDGRSLAPDAVAAVARGKEPVVLDAAAQTRNAAARQTIAEYLASGQLLYGGNTGVGAFRDREVATADRQQYQWNLLRSHAVTAGPVLPVESVRATMVVRANQLGAGGAGVAAELLDGLVAALNQDVTPVSRGIGSIGTGDLPALADIALAILGEGRVWRGGEMLTAWPLVGDVNLDLRDALGFMSSNALTLGQAALLSVDVRRLQQAWMTVAALSFEAFDADLVVLDDRVQAAVGAAGQRTVAARMRELLAGAALGTSAETPVQHPYPFRVLPQVDGVTEDALTALEDMVGRGINGRGENALIVDGLALPNGNFHAAELAGALDRLRAALAQSCSLIAVRISAMMDPRTSGLPTFLSAQPGLESGVMMLEFTAQSAAAHARALAPTVGVQTVGASLGVESHSSLAAEALGLTVESIQALSVVVATELVVTLRALELAGRTPAGAGARPLFEQARAVLPAGLEDRRFGADVELARELLRQIYWTLD